MYIAAGEIYGGDTHVSELKSLFSNIVFKEMLATKEELKTFSDHASRSAAALDYIVSIESDVIIPSHSGNMARTVEGHRRYIGHRKTITPDRKGLVELFDKLEDGKLGVSSLSRLVQKLHQNRYGAPRKRGGAPPGIKGRARRRLDESFSRAHSLNAYVSRKMLPGEMQKFGRCCQVKCKSCTSSLRKEKRKSKCGFCYWKIEVRCI